MRDACGFSLVELLGVIAVMAIIAGLALPLLNQVMPRVRFSASVRDVERELQTARLTAVSSNRPMRVRFDCPSAGRFRMVELIGTPNLPASADGSSSRCDPTTYPFKTADQSLITRPSHDGPVRQLSRAIGFTSGETIEFWPDGTAHAQGSSTGNPWPIIGPTGVTITLQSTAIPSLTKSITVNGLGKIRIQ